jgi:hypothetical protein
MNAKSFFFVALLVAGAWWYRTNSANEPAPASSHSTSRSRLRETGKQTQESASSTNATRRQPVALPDQGADQDRERQRLKALQEQSFKEIERKDAEYQRALAEYDRRRKEIADQQSALEGGNRHGMNNSAIEQLEQQRQRLTMPQRQ